MPCTKSCRKVDESTMSYVNRLGVAFAEIGDSVTVKDFHAFILLRQSNLSSDDKKKVLTMTGGKMEIKAIDQAMRSLATRVLSGPGDVKKKVYPVNFTEEENSEAVEGGETAWNVAHDDEDDWDNFDYLVQQGDADALTVQTFENDLEDLFQSTPDLQAALVSYQEARQKLTERKKFRGFWPTRSFGGKGKNKGKKGSKSFGGYGKSSLLDRIAKTHCKLCGEKGHWKAECPHKTKENANIAISSHVVDHSVTDLLSTHVPDVLVEEARLQCLDFDQAFCVEVFDELEYLFACHTTPGRNSNVSWKESAISILSHRIEQRKRQTNEIRTPCILPDSSDDLSSNDRSTAFHVTVDGSFAVLDTGASRSVIGSQLVPSLLKDLSAEIRAKVREVPSRVGFRFGNNEVLYSQYQVQIPLCQNKGKRIWLIVEVVKGLTPFLLSIHAMKCLGAQIDLEKSQVYLRNLQRSIAIHENKNGLMSVRLQDLCDAKFGRENCKEQTICASQHLVSSSLEEPSIDHSVDQSRHADSSRDDSEHQNSGRTGHGQFESFASVTGQPCRSSCNSPTSSGRESDTSPAIDVRGATAEAPDRRNLTTAPTSRESSPSIHAITDRHRFRPRVGADIKYGVSSSKCEFSTQGTDDNQCSHACCDSNDATNDRCANYSDSSNISFEQSGDNKSRGCPGDSGGKSAESGIMGSEVHQLGKEVDRSSLSRSLRTGSGIRSLDCCPGQHPDTADEGLFHVLPEPREDGARSLDQDASHLVQQDFFQLLLANFVTNPWEEKMLKDSLIGVVPKAPIDLLEVYASENSRLTQAVQDLGGKSLRFTKADGDLSTKEGQIKLLRWVYEYSPRHLWLAPECLPWCAWNRFNQGRSLQQWMRVHDLQNEPRIHLKFCNLLMKIQRENNRHCHLENPHGSGLWEQPEISESLRCTLPAKFDQCQMGLKHPQNRQLIRKRTIVATTSKELHATLDDRLCTGQHVHSPISGSCKFAGKNVLVSRFAAFYPTGLAKRIAKCFMKGVHTHVDFPVYPVEEIENEGEEEANQRPTKRAKKGNEDIHEERPLPEEPIESRAKRPVHKGILKINSRRGKSEQVLPEHSWTSIFQQLKSKLPRVGAKEFRATEPIFQEIQSLCPELRIIQVVACKGVEKFLAGDSSCSHRKTIVLKRFTNEIIDLGCEEWTKLSQTQQRRKALPSHIMICVFGDLVTEGSSSAPLEPRVPQEPSFEELMQDSAVNPDGRDSPILQDDKNTYRDELDSIIPWTPAPVSQSGPKYDALPSSDKAILRKLHHNLGHPTADTLSRPLSLPRSQE